MRRRVQEKAGNNIDVHVLNVRAHSLSPRICTVRIQYQETAISFASQIDRHVLFNICCYTLRLSMYNLETTEKIDQKRDHSLWKLSQRCPWYKTAIQK